MKKIIVTIAILTAITFTNNVFANDGFKIVNLTPKAEVTFKTLNGLKVKLTIAESQGNSYITIKDTKGEEIYKETVKKSNNFTKVYDLNEFPTGKYVITVVNDSEVKVKEIEIVSSSKRIVE